MKKSIREELVEKFGEPLIEEIIQSAGAPTEEEVCNDCNHEQHCGNCQCCGGAPNLGDGGMGRKNDIAKHLENKVFNKLMSRLSERFGEKVHSDIATKGGKKYVGIPSDMDESDEVDEAKPKKKERKK